MRLLPNEWETSELGKKKTHKGLIILVELDSAKEISALHTSLQ
jgi:hypothetical protein